MAEILVSVAAKVIEYLVEPTIQQGRYLFCASKIIKNLEDEKKKLVSTKDEVQNRAEEAKRKTEKVENAVENWMNAVTKLLAEVETLQLEMNQHNSCCQRWIPRRRTYHLCRQMAKKTKMIIELNNRNKFEKFSRLATLPSIEYFSSGNFICFESTQSAYNQLLEAIKEADSYMIGLYGMGGCGKTTLAKEVGKKAKELNLFDRVAFTTVTQTPNIRKIQGEIADLLGLKLDEETEAGRARRISLKLKSGDRILLILDDVWEMLNLEDIGIPLKENHGACKVILTTRRRPVCTVMDCDRRIQLDLLSDREAMILLQRHAKTYTDSCSGSLNELEWGIVRECKGLPLAIEVVGRSLRDKSTDDWKVAVDKLEHSKPVDIEPGDKDVFACLKLSYDFLQNRLAQSLLLMCSMFREDHEILIEDLFRCVVGTDLCGDVQSFDMARLQVNKSIKMLIDSSLLMYPQVRMDHVKLHDRITDWDLTLTTLNQEEDGLAVWWDDERKDRVKMHDMVRDVALWIASQEDHTVMLNTVRDLKAKATDCFGVSLRDKDIAELSNQIIAPKLEILLMHSENSLELPNAFLEGSERLKAMIIKCESRMPPFLSLPHSIHKLTNLRVLRLVKWQLGDISFVVSLAILEVLDLIGSQLIFLPSGIQKLSKLKLLDLSWCKIELDCSEVIARCAQLEELYAFGSNIFRGTIDSYEFFRGGSAFPKLQRYSLEIGGCDYDLQIALGYSSCKKSLRIADNIWRGSSPILCDLLRRSEEVFMHQVSRLAWTTKKKIAGHLALFSGMFSSTGVMNELTFLHLSHCNWLSCLIDEYTKYDELPPKLDTIVLSDIPLMGVLCFGPPPLGFFKKLKRLQISECGALFTIFPKESNLCNLMKLTISSCPMLNSLFPLSVAKSMAQLQQLTIERCPALTTIMSVDYVNPVSQIKQHFFPKLKILSVDSCDKLEYLLPVSCVVGLVELESLSITKSSSLKFVFIDVSDSSPPEEIQKKLSVLKLLTLKSLPNLVSIFPYCYESSCPSLKKLICEECPSLTLPDSISGNQN